MPAPPPVSAPPRVSTSPPVPAPPRVFSPPIASAVPPLSAAPKAVSRRRPQASAARKAGKKGSKIDTILQKANRSLKQRIKEKGDFRDFLMRSYQRYYHKSALSDQESYERLQKGLKYPGSLKAILKNVRREYEGPHLQRYALAKIFKILRSEAKLLLEYR